MKSLNGLAGGLLAEQFRTLAFKFRGLRNKGHRTFAITSAKQDEGKTFVCVHLATQLSCEGEPVLLIDFDNRRPALHKYLGLKNERGFVDLANSDGGLDLNAVLQEPQDNLFVVPSGPPAKEMRTTVRSESAMKTLLQQAQRFSFILIDTPPILAVSDAQLISPMADGIILVVNSSSTKDKEVKTAKRMIEGAGGRIVGTVLNKFDLKFGMGNQKYYDDYVTPRSS